MAFDIRPPATNSSNKSTSRSSSSSAAKGANVEPFAAQLAAKLPKQPATPKQTPAPKPTSAAKQPAPSKQSSASKTAQAKSSQPSHSDDSPQKPGAAHQTDRSKTDPTRTNASPSPQDESANQDPASDNPYSDGDTSTENPAKGNTKDVGKGRGASRGTADKAARTAQSDAVASQLETLAKDPTADAADTSGLSLLQLIAQASEGGDDSDPASSVTDEPKAATDDDKVADTDPNAQVLAMLSQLFAGVVGHPATPPNGAATSGTSDSGTADGIAAGAVDTARSSNGATADQALLSLLEQKLGADGSDKADTQSSDTAAAATSSPDNKSAVDGTTVRPDAVAQSFGQMGIASHFARNTYTVALQSNVGTPAWKDELGGQLTYMTHRGLESGSLRVSPEHLGPVEVQITVQNGDASVYFGATHPDTRAALEQALPRLREMFAQQGLTLTDSGVSREPPRNQTRSRTPQSIAAVSASAGADTSTAVATRISLGLVDTYA